MSNWHPIKTAPKDGTWILILCPESIQGDEMPKPCVFTDRWIQETTEWWERSDAATKKLRKEDSSHWDSYEDPTHWMPLPAMPDTERV